MLRLRSWPLTWLLLLLLCGTGSFALAQGSDGQKPSEEEIAEITRQKAAEQAALDAKKKATSAQLSEKRKERRNVLGELNVIDHDLVKTRTRLNALQSELQQQQEELARTRSQHERYLTSYESAQRRLGARLRTWYKHQQAPLVTMFFASTDANELSYKLRYAEAALSADRKTIDFIQEQRTLLADSHAVMAVELERTEDLARQVDAERAKFAELRQAKASTLSAIDSDVRKLERAFAELEQSSREIEWFLASLSGEGSPQFHGTFIHPLPGRKISSGFGYRHHPILKRRKMHTGLDIPAPAGTPIKAAAAGTVVFSGWKNGYGKCVIINHGKGFATLYAHMSTINLREGQTVNQGAIVGGVGTTGMSTGNHLHFEVRINGKPVNPSTYV